MRTLCPHVRTARASWGRPMGMRMASRSRLRSCEVVVLYVYRFRFQYGTRRDYREWGSRDPTKRTFSSFSSRVLIIRSMISSHAGGARGGRGGRR